MLRIVFPFAFASFLPALCLIAATQFGGAWPVISVLVMTVMVFCLDKLTGDDWAMPTDATGHLLSVAIGLLHFVVLGCVVWALGGGRSLSALDAVLIYVAAGLWFGQVSNSNAHELIHRSARVPRRLGVAVYISLLFGHHASAHRKVHHFFAATDQDPHSAHLGEGFFRFVHRAWRGGFFEGLKAENIWRAKSPEVLPGWQHPYVGYVVGACLTLGGAFVLAGRQGVAVLCLIAIYAQLQLFLSDYVQHYGLRRARQKNGSYVPMGPQHSWNAPHWYSSALMLNAPRHSDHHMHPNRPFPSLDLQAEDMPILPHSLPVMACLALWPKMWRRIMDPRVAQWNEADSGVPKR